jgi:DDE superfamily endonuclease
VVDKKCQKIVCTAFSNGKQHDFRLYKQSKTHIHPSISALTDSGYQGLQKLHAKTQMPKKRSKKHPLTEIDKKNNRQLSSDRVLNENVIGCLKRFKIIADRYRNRRKRFGLRFNLIAGIYNWELPK